jgi:hypothetical protein
MKAEELRLGNWVNPNLPMQVTCIHKDEILCDFEGNEGDMFEFDPKDLNGIPLTEEWFKKFGFQKHHISHAWYDKNYEIRIDKTDSCFLVDCDWYLIVKYVHELQNICYALIGHEL